MPLFVDIRDFTLVSVVAIVTTLVGCSNSAAEPAGVGGSGGTTGTATGNAGASATAGVAGTVAGGGLSATGGEAGSNGAAGSMVGGGMGGSGMGGGGMGGGGGTGGSGGTSTGGAGMSGAGGTGTAPSELSKGPFTCSTYIGGGLTNQWWGHGFETIVDNAKWQLKWHEHGFVEAWGDPQSPFWGDTGDPTNLTSGSPIQSACAQNSTTPDRVVFLAMDWVLLTEQGWVDWLEKDLTAIQLKYPSAKWIDIMPTVRCPNNQMCNPNAMPGPGANDGAGPEDCYIPPFEDSAIVKVVAAHADSVGLGPIVMAKTCNGGDGAHLTDMDNTLAATAIGNFYKALP